MAKKTKYVLHLHNAFRAGRHFDFRIKYLDKKMLISFAIPKEKLPYSPGDRAIAIQTPDHGMGWLYREKLQIPRGTYGGGFIKRLQYGECEIHVWRDDYLKFSVEDEGPFLRGEYYMLLSKYKKTDKNPIWILGKKKETESLSKSLKSNELRSIARFNIIDIEKGELL